MIIDRLGYSLYDNLYSGLRFRLKSNLSDSGLPDSLSDRLRADMWSRREDLSNILWLSLWVSLVDDLE